jgi:5-formyltetrahydrofolate cyclo-ligase
MASAESVALADQKRSLRRAMGERRSTLGPGARARAVDAATARMVALPEIREAVARGAFVAGFVATRAEIDPAPALDQARAQGARVVLPRVGGRVRADGAGTPTAGSGRDVGIAAGADSGAQKELDVNDVNRGVPGGPRMRFHTAASNELRLGPLGIYEPDPGCPEVQPAEVAVMIVPGLAFDASGRRLGFGGGYYDEVLGVGRPGRPGLVVGFGYDFQVVDSCPADDHDARVDCVVTDARVIRCNGTSTDDVGAAAEVET